MRRELPGSVRMWMETVDEWEPDVVVTDFEPLSGIYARWSRTPLICVDNIHMIDRCRHDKAIVDGAREDFRIARAVTRAMVPTAGDYVITTFFEPPLLRGRTSLVPPIVRPAIVEAQPTRGDHLVVYSGGSEELIEVLRDTGVALSRVRDARRPAGRHDRRRHRVLRALGRRLPRGPRDRARRGHRRRLLAAQRGGLPRQAGPRRSRCAGSSSSS